MFAVGSQTRTISVDPLGGGNGVDTDVTITLTSTTDSSTVVGSGIDCNPATIKVFDYTNPACVGRSFVKLSCVR